MKVVCTLFHGSATHAVLQLLTANPTKVFVRAQLVEQTGCSLKAINWALELLRAQGRICTLPSMSGSDQISRYRITEKVVDARPNMPNARSQTSTSEKTKGVAPVGAKQSVEQVRADKLRARLKEFYRRARQYDEKCCANRVPYSDREHPSLPADLVDLNCGATGKRSGKPCRCQAIYANGRCRFHGGLSTGPVSDAGKQASARNGKLGGRPRKAKVDSGG